VNPAKKAELLKKWAVEAGFDRAGVARLEPSEHRQALSRWLEKGDHASMKYMERRSETRLNPATLLPQSRTVLCCALQYYPLDSCEPVSGNLWSRVARYARGRDYHDIMLRMLRAVAAKIEEAFPGSRTRPYVDTGPILERELAARAGLGAVGKNTNLLHPEGGSWFLLGEVLTTLELQPDPAIEDLCGTCTACLEACPTGALPEPYRLDSNRCISYWTIEHRGDFPDSIRQSLEDWVFGCDICQDVCPLNDAPSSGDHPEFSIPPERKDLDLSGLLSLTREEYTEAFRGSPLKRAKFEGLKRNAAIAMGNRGEKKYVSVLKRALDDTDAVVRRSAAWALGRIGSGSK
jgi:epoxyqueuosine reductase